MKDSDGNPCPLEPRVILQNVLARFHQHGLFPVIAPEIEFYLTGQAIGSAKSGLLSYGYLDGTRGAV
jgi:gamma-glutamylputrescine synthase